MRRLWQSQGVEVNRLKRIGFGPIELSSIVRKGEFMYLNEYQTKSLFGIVQLDAIYHPEKEIYRDMRQRKEKKLRARGSNNSQKKTKNT